MNVVIDIGNTFIKLAIFNQNELIETVVEEEINEKTIDSLLQKYAIGKGIYSSVRVTDKSLLKKYNFLALSHHTPLPLAIKYKTPETLGLDRIAAVVGANTSYKNTNVLVMDLGTCITYDFITAKNQYLGGAIAPGFNMRFKALNQFTGKLPIVDYKKEQLKLVGDTTENSIISGVYNGMKNEILGTINSYSSQYESLKIVVTGGDINLFDLEPKNRIFADEFLVLKGLNEILNYNEKN
jgi:type III pantothenate kinase